MTTHPMELTFIVSGKATLEQRRPLAESIPSRGALHSTDASVQGSTLGAHLDLARRRARRPARRRRRARRLDRFGAGTRLSTTGARARTTARARTRCTRAPSSRKVRSPSPRRSIDRPRDNVNSDQDVATALRSIVHGSYAGGVDGAVAAARAAVALPAPTAFLATGSHPEPLGMSDGELYDSETTDPRLLPHFRRMKSKIEPLWQNAFPRSAILDLKQGTVILEFIVNKDGTARVMWPPARPSGIGEFDRNCADAIRRAMPFEPIPAALGVTSLHVRAPFIANNFVVK